MRWFMISSEQEVAVGSKVCDSLQSQFNSLRASVNGRRRGRTRCPQNCTSRLTNNHGRRSRIKEFPHRKSDKQATLSVIIAPIPSFSTHTATGGNTPNAHATTSPARSQLRLRRDLPSQRRIRDLLLPQRRARRVFQILRDHRVVVSVRSTYNEEGERAGGRSRGLGSCSRPTRPCGPSCPGSCDPEAHSISRDPADAAAAAADDDDDAI